MKVLKLSIILILFLALTANKCQKSELPSVGDVITKIEQELMINSSLQYLYGWHITRREGALFFYFSDSTSHSYPGYALIKHKKKYLLKKFGDTPDQIFSFSIEEKEKYIESKEIKSMDFLHVKKVFDELHLFSVAPRKKGNILMFSFMEPLTLIYSYKENKDIGETVYNTYTPFNEHWFFVKWSSHD